MVFRKLHFEQKSRLILRLNRQDQMRDDRSFFRADNNGIDFQLKLIEC